MKASDLFVQCLIREGIDTVFGLPGEENADMALSLADAETDIDFVLTRHEQGASFMADVHGRLTGNPGVCLGTLGPGATNLITGVANSNMDRSPLIVITGQGTTERLHKESHQIMDSVAMYAPVTKWSHAVERADTIPEVVRKAVRIARSAKPGAVHIDLPEDIAASDTDATPLQPHRYAHPGAEAGTVAALADAIAAARRPIVLAGNGVVRTGASAALRRFCAQTGIGALNTFMAKGVIDHRDPLCLYTIGLQQRDYTAFAIDAADLVIAIGYDLVEYPPRLWNVEGTCRIVHIDTDGAEIDRFYHPDVEAVGSIAATLDAVCDRLAAGDTAPAYDLAFQRELRAQMDNDFAAHADDDTEGSIRPQKLIADIQAALGPDDIVLSGVGAHKMWIARYLQRAEPNTCLIPNGFCSMGMPLPGSIAAHRLHPDRRIVGIAGDGDFLMNVQEMETAHRLDADITMIVWEDHGYGLIEWKQQGHFGRHSPLTFGNPDWMALAGAFGWHGQRVDNARDFAGALDTALTHRGPSLLVATVDYRENMLLSERLGHLQCPI